MNDNKIYFTYKSQTLLTYTYIVSYMSNYERQVNIVVSAAKECAPNVTLDRLEEKEYEIHANDETMYLNPLKEVYGVHDETVEDGIILFTNYEKAMGEFIKRIR